MQCALTSLLSTVEVHPAYAHRFPVVGVINICLVFLSVRISATHLHTCVAKVMPVKKVYQPFPARFTMVPTFNVNWKSPYNLQRQLKITSKLTRSTENHLQTQKVNWKSFQNPQGQLNIMSEFTKWTENYIPIHQINWKSCQNPNRQSKITSQPTTSIESHLPTQNVN